jgi:hypothetical protein
LKINSKWSANLDWEGYFTRFVDVSLTQYLEKELELVNQAILSDLEPRRSNQKTLSKSAKAFHSFIDGMLLVSEHLIHTIALSQIPMLIAKKLFNFFHSEEKTQPL